LRYAYYPGCSLHASAREYDLSWRAVCEKLGIELTELPDWSCCGTAHADNVDYSLSVAMAARNLAIAAQMGLPIAAPCSGCYKTLWRSEAALRTDPTLRQKINATLSRPLEGPVAVRHPLYIILEDIGLEALSAPPRPLRGLSIAPYYGCVLTRPVAEPPVDDPEDPQGLDRLLHTLGAEVVPYPAKSKCCGGAVLLSHPDVALDLTARLLTAAKRAGAQCLAVACPMCQMALDAYQQQAERQSGEHFDLPILYFTQLLGVALGLDDRRLGLERLVTSPARIMAKI
jgi:heterodisulfide reductase subunit B